MDEMEDHYEEQETWQMSAARNKTRSALLYRHIISFHQLIVRGLYHLFYVAGILLWQYMHHHSFSASFFGCVCTILDWFMLLDTPRHVVSSYVIPHYNSFLKY